MRWSTLTCGPSRLAADPTRYFVWPVLEPLLGGGGFTTCALDSRLRHEWVGLRGDLHSREGVWRGAWVVGDARACTRARARYTYPHGVWVVGDTQA